MGAAQRRRRKVDYEEGDEGVLDGEKEVLAICREGEVVAERVSGCYRVRQSLQHVGRQGETAGRTCGYDCGYVK